MKYDMDILKTLAAFYSTLCFNFFFFFHFFLFLANYPEGMIDGIILLKQLNYLQLHIAKTGANR